MCMGDKIHELRVSKGITYSDIASKTKIPPNIIKSSEIYHKNLYMSEIQKLAEVLGVYYIDLCTTWEEVYNCLYNSLDELFMVASRNDKVKYRNAGYYLNDYTSIPPERYRVKVIETMNNKFKCDLLGVPIIYKGISERAKLKKKTDTLITLYEVCQSSFENNIKLSYILSGQD